jgi:hypothetical protein
LTFYLERAILFARTLGDTHPAAVEAARLYADAKERTE